MDMVRPGPTAAGETQSSVSRGRLRTPGAGTPRVPVGYAPQLDGLRALAVLSVLFFHTLSSRFSGGYVGVDVFFVLSGFLITGILVREHDEFGGVSLRRFYLRRALRLLPALFFMALVLSCSYLVLLDPEQRDENLKAVGAAVGYISSPLTAAGVGLGSMEHTWSLSVEEYFYVLWPFALIAILVLAGPRRRVPVVAGVTLFAVAYRLTAAFVGWPFDRIYYAADTRAEQLLLGGLLAVLAIRYRLRPSPPLVAAAGVALVVYVVTPSTATASFYLYGGSTVIAALAAMVIVGVVGRPESGLSRGLSTRPLVWVGKRSYGIYLWHLPVAALIALALPPVVPVLPVDLALTLVVAMLSYRYVEQPFLRWNARFRRAIPPRPVAVAEPDAAIGIAGRAE